MDLARQAIRIGTEAAGARAHLLGNLLQRALRDIDVMVSHVVYDLDGALELHGGALGRPFVQFRGHLIGPTRLQAGFGPCYWLDVDGFFRRRTARQGYGRDRTSLRHVQPSGGLGLVR